MSNADEARVRANEQFIADTIARKERGEFTPWDIVCGMEEPLYDIRELRRRSCSCPKDWTGTPRAQ